MKKSFLIIALGLAGPALAEGEFSAGAELFAICSGCHQIGQDAVTGFAPHLNGLIGRQIAGIEDFTYSEALSGMDGIWTVEALDAFLRDPEGFAPGTLMGIGGLEDATERAALIAFVEAEGAAMASGGVAPEVTAILALPPDEAYGAYLSSECTACHSSGDDIPAISGLAPEALVAGLLDYRSGAREHQVMTMVAARLGNEEIAALAAYFATAE